MCLVPDVCCFLWAAHVSMLRHDMLMCGVMGRLGRSRASIRDFDGGVIGFCVRDARYFDMRRAAIEHAEL
ncbi:hypothetical protein AA106556_0033 [Neokomagataea tanensis NBRC 106556]|uniref:Secreted protein n=1 Tax=Neokomagataea tanensis NBRC 106556 TaxID=1223519 RepID=A0ABQ0QFU5_9PROT|nr:hypothetical protein AA106556_0033 [Neokomagataea tanensis NBRC 106556]